MKLLRTLHLYAGVFFSPALLFFAFTGAVQTFSLHETTRGSSYKPPAILVTLAQLHKKQTIVVPARKLAPAAEGKGDKQVKSDKAEGGANKPSGDAAAPKQDGAPAVAPARTHNLWPMKIFFLFCALALFQAVVTGLYMAYNFMRDKKLVTATLLAGIVLPLLLLLF